MRIKIYVNGQKMSVPSAKDLALLNSIVADSQAFVTFKFELSEDWRGLIVFAQFVQNGNAYNQFLTSNNEAFLPAEIENGMCTMMLYGSDGEKTGTTNGLTFTVKDSGYVSDAQSTEISRSLYDQLIDMYADLRLLVDSDDLKETIGEKLELYLSGNNLSDDISANSAARHTHANQALLDLITQEQISALERASGAVTKSEMSEALTDYYTRLQTNALLAAKKDGPALVDSAGTELTLADNTEYRLQGVATLNLIYPAGGFEAFLRVTFSDQGTITVSFPAGTRYIGALPDFSNGETWEISVKDGVVVCGKVGG